MTTTLRIVLILFSIITAILVIRKVKQSKLKTEDSVIWIIGSIILIVMTIFSGLVEWVAVKLGFMTTVNFVLVSISFFLLLTTFNQNIKISLLNENIKNLNHHIALKEYDEKEKQENAEAGKEARNKE